MVLEGHQLGFEVAASRECDDGESANLSRYQILTQTGVAALSQANQASASVLRLLQ